LDSLRKKPSGVLTIIIPRNCGMKIKEIISRPAQLAQRIDHYENRACQQIRREAEHFPHGRPPVRDSTGKVDRRSKVAPRITERKRLREAEEARRISEARLELALEASKAAFFRVGHGKKSGASEFADEPRSMVSLRRGRNYRRGVAKPVPCRRSRQIIEGKRTRSTGRRTISNSNIERFGPTANWRWILSQGRILRDAHGKALQMNWYPRGYHAAETGRRSPASRGTAVPGAG